MNKLGPFKKLGTHWWFELFDYDKDIEKMIIDEIDRFESAYSRFLPDSLVGQLNEKRELINPPQEFLDILRKGLDAYKTTDGVFNITAGGVLENRGYDATYSFTKRDGEHSLSDPHDSISIETEREKVVVRLHGDTRIDFGGFGKGYLIDVLANMLKEKGVAYFLINGGGDMYATSNHDEPVEILLQNPIDRSKALGKLEIENEAFTASSPHVRRWGTDSAETHLVSEQKTKLSSVFVLAKSAADADIWATTLSINQKATTPDDIEFTIID